MVYFGWPSASVVMASANPVLQAPLLCAVAWLLRAEKPAWPIAFAIIYVLVSGLLAELWGEAGWSGFLIAGQLMYSDSSGYLLDASRVAHGQLMLSQGAWRPIAHTFLASHLYIFDGNLRLIHLVFAIWQTLALLFAARVICRRVHWVATIGSIGVVLAFLTHFAGAFMAEYVGVMLSVIAVGCLVEAAARRDDIRWHLLALGVLTLALLTRAGAFFVLPGILAWSCWVARNRWIDRLVLVCLGVGVVAAAFLFNKTLSLAVAGASEVLGNFYYALYGMVIGETWQSAVATGKSFEELRRESLAIIADRPVVLLEAFWRGIRLYFGQGMDYAGWFSQSFLIGRLLQVSALATVVCGFILRRRQPLYLMLGFALAGFVASLPFAPPWDADGRIYAATVSLSALAAGLGFALPFILWTKSKAAQRDAGQSTISFRFPTLFLTTFIVASYVGPIAILKALPHPQLLPDRNDDGTITVPLKEGAYIVLHDKLSGRPYPPHLQKDSWLEKSVGFSYFWAKEFEFIEMLPANCVITQRYGAGIHVLPMDALRHVGEQRSYHGYSTYFGGLAVFIDQSFHNFIERVEAHQLTHAENVRYPFLRGFNFAFYPWISHPRLGFLWVNEEESDPDRVYLFSRDPLYGHLYTSPGMFPRFVRLSDNSQIEFVSSSGKVINRTTGEELPLPKDPPAE